jgi:Zn-dependent protease with chaperone function
MTAGPADRGLAGSSTTIRFVLLLIAMVVATASIGEVVQTPAQASAQRRSAQCRREIKAQLFHEELARQRGVAGYSVRDVPVPAGYQPSGDDLELYNLYSAGCPGDGSLLPGLAGLVSLAGLFTGAALIYWLLPGWRRRQRHLVDLDAAGIPQDLADDVEHLVRDAGVQVTVLVNPTEYRADGIAFGHLGHRYIEITSGMLAMHTEDRAGFKAIFAHELGHIRNRDLDVTHLTVALWRSFVFLSVAALAVLRVNPGSVANGLHLATLWLVVYLTRNGLLRAREYAADAFSARRNRPALVRLLERRRTNETIWSILPGTHPRAAKRIAALRPDRPPHDLSYGDAFALGAVAWLALPISMSWRLNFAVAMLARRAHLITNIDVLTGGYPWVSLSVLVPTTAALAVATWRIATAGRAARLIPLTLALVAGAESAITVTPRTSDLSVRWAGAPIAVYYLVVAFSTVAAVAVLAAACLAWRRAADLLPTRRQPWIIGGYGALLALVYAPHAMPWAGVVLLGFPLVGLVLSRYRGGRPGLSPAPAEPARDVCVPNDSSAPP